MLHLRTTIINLNGNVIYYPEAALLGMTFISCLVYILTLNRSRAESISEVCVRHEFADEVCGITFTLAASIIWLGKDKKKIQKWSDAVPFLLRGEALITSLYYTSMVISEPIPATKLPLQQLILTLSQYPKPSELQYYCFTKINHLRLTKHLENILDTN